MEGDAMFPQQLIFENVSPATRLLEKRRQMYEVQDALENQKQKGIKEEESFKKKEDQLRAKDLQLQHQLIKFNKFLQDNEAKRRRAETRATEEMVQIKQKEEEISQLSKQLDESQQLCAQLEQEVARNIKYEEFLEKVKDSCDDYSEIQDLVTRYETLESAHQDLVDAQTQFDQRNEALRTEFQNYKKQKAMEILAFTNRTASLQSELEEVEKSRQHFEYLSEEARQQQSEQSLYLGQILMSVENLFLRCTTKRPAIQHSNELQHEKGSLTAAQKAIRQLKVISAYVHDFRDIADTLKRTGRDKKQVQVVADFVRSSEPEFIYHAAPTDGSAKTSSQPTLSRDLPSAFQPNFDG
eukprot:GEMP01034038.1.p1 GENE.GEMP01034038.1~~GEMP01034038.1.p1  ORF type:complete len:375 (+),score=100.29 GEMP01034038.1:65-1126(+)